MARTRRIWPKLVIVLLVILAILAWLFSWNLLRGPIARKVTEATGRSAAINGDLHVKLSFTQSPWITADNVQLGNPDWATNKNMFTADRLALQLRFWPLLSGKVELPEIVLENPVVAVEKNADGTLASWNMTADGKPAPATASSASSNKVALGHLQIHNGKVHYQDPKPKDVVDGTISTFSPGAGQEDMIRVSANGQFQQMKLNLGGTGGALLDLRDPSKPYPLDASGTVGETKFAAKGTVTDPGHLSGMHLDFKISGASLSQLYQIAHVPLPATPAYSLAGLLEHHAEVWNLQGFSGRVGNSDLNGDFSIDRAPKPQYIKANLTSKNLDMKDLSGFIGARNDKGKTEVPAGDKVLPQSEFDLEKINAANGDIWFKGQHLKTDRLPLNNLVAHMVLDNGRLTLDPLNVEVASGQVNSKIGLDTSAKPLKVKADVKAAKLQLRELFPEMKIQKANVGTVGGQATIATQGNSVAQMLGAANGNAAVIMNGGAVSKLILRLSNLDLANTLPILLTGDKEVPVRCFVGDLGVKNGDATIRTLILDTEKQVINGTGTINFKDEKMNIQLTSTPKDKSLAAFRGPILVDGTFKHPSARPAVGQLAGRSGVAVALGVLVNPIAALIPLIDLGGAKDTDCGAMIHQASSNSTKDSADKASNKVKPQVK
ncbi:AsmA family protein [Amantichitinum ursilacus]|uniref:Putative assembly protein n=1 Tax=Amantichitinum ursilacus TaxID=857265 RepID=A0A0N1JTT1_9NEIS|nr:AsmA family protein [Amantichitinum ursilacus]KPC55045.1 putative assembly protein [Amantichitinum ursilacus]